MVLMIMRASAQTMLAARQKQLPARWHAGEASCVCTPALAAQAF
jgi:hypothetical protein